MSWSVMLEHSLSLDMDLPLRDTSEGHLRFGFHLELSFSLSSFKYATLSIFRVPIEFTAQAVVSERR